MCVGEGGWECNVALCVYVCLCACECFVHHFGCHSFILHYVNVSNIEMGGYKGGAQ